MNRKNTFTRLINNFRRQTRTTILQHLDSLAHSPRVYSQQFAGIGPHLNSYRLFAFIDRHSFVLLCIDKADGIVELADEEMYGDEPPRYFTCDSHRKSPVWMLSETLKLIRLHFSEQNISLKVHGLLLTENTIVNADDIRPEWDRMGISVIDQMECMDEKTISVNPDESLTFGHEAMQAIADIVKTPDQARKDENDDFARMLDDFMAALEGNANTDDTDDTPEQEEPDTTDSDTDGCSGDFSAAIDIPSGIVEQNNNLSVKVQILPPLPNPRAELDKLVGCQDIKARLDELLALTRYNQILLSAYPQSKLHEVSLHSIFFGRPGTGKTTVCKIFGSILHEAGALSKGHVVVANRGTFLGTLWGDEERSVRQVIDMAMGGVLMIDEAYLLNGKHEQDPGRIVVQLLMDLLADEGRRNIAVVLCGYKEPMMRLLDTNPGLQSRFPNRFEFKDFSVDDLLEISRRRVDEYQYHFTPQAWQKYRDVLSEAYAVRDPQSWGNARFVANQLERIYIQHARRCTAGRPVSDKQLLTLTPADIVPIEVARAPRHVGF